MDVLTSVKSGKRQTSSRRRMQLALIDVLLVDLMVAEESRKRKSKPQPPTVAQLPQSEWLAGFDPATLHIYAEQCL